MTETILLIKKYGYNKFMDSEFISEMFATRTRSTSVSWRWVTLAPRIPGTTSTRTVLGSSSEVFPMISQKEIYFVSFHSKSYLQAHITITKTSYRKISQCLEEAWNHIIKSPRYTGGGFMFLPLSPPGWRGIVVTVRAGGRTGGRAVGGAAARLAEPISL